jgi:formylglycine-generating enzyme required for sulfatase activity
VTLGFSFKAAAATLMLALLALGRPGAMTALFSHGLPASAERPDLVELPPGTFAYRMAGDFNVAGRPVTAPLVTHRFEGAIDVMRHQVTVGEYKRCVAAGVCQKLAAEAGRGADFPVVQVSWQDATAYAAWLSANTGETYRLPTDEEWAYAAGGRFRDDAIGPAGDPADPSKAWLARYDREATAQAQPGSRTRPIGSFGANEHGLLDLAGNVWEWTNTCFLRQSLGQARPAALLVNCGVRVVEGQHRSYVPNFIRDARAGGCAVGAPPNNLGFRLIREPGSKLRPLL